MRNLRKGIQYQDSFITQLHHLPSFIRAFVTCCSALAHTERVQGRAEHSRWDGFWEHWQGTDVATEKQLLAGTAAGSRDQQGKRELQRETLLQRTYRHLLPSPAVQVPSLSNPPQLSSPTQQSLCPLGWGVLGSSCLLCSRSPRRRQIFLSCYVPCPNAQQWAESHCSAMVLPGRQQAWLGRVTPFYLLICLSPPLSRSCCLSFSLHLFQSFSSAGALGCVSSLEWWGGVQLRIRHWCSASCRGGVCRGTSCQGALLTCGAPGRAVKRTEK